MNTKTVSNGLLSLDEYIRIAEKIVCSFCRCRGSFLMKLLMSDESISNIANKLMIADIKFNGSGNINGYRKRCATWEICKIIQQSRLRKNSNVQFSQRLYNDETIPIDDIMETIINRRSRDERDPLANLMEDELNKEVWYVLDMAVQSNVITQESKSRLLSYIVDGMSMEEIAEAKGVSKQAISENISNTLKKLRKFIEGFKTNLGNLPNSPKTLC